MYTLICTDPGAGTAVFWTRFGPLRGPEMGSDVRGVLNAIRAPTGARIGFRPVSCSGLMLGLLSLGGNKIYIQWYINISVYIYMYCLGCCKLVLNHRRDCGLQEYGLERGLPVEGLGRAHADPLVRCLVTWLFNGRLGGCSDICVYIYCFFWELSRPKKIGKCVWQFHTTKKTTILTTCFVVAYVVFCFVCDGLSIRFPDAANRHSVARIVAAPKNRKISLTISHNIPNDRFQKKIQ